ncbi:hypothetical protein AFE02nite_20830 [Actinotalea fermentans]|uniref:Uncharacterized protein n=1 Tax=Actinotalea fermentans TaxID=43671 RepID=A0A511YYT0_9CELL|nr:hypothetical protein AFE02nite_20830 [Actinotalea fermentans]
MLPGDGDEPDAVAGQDEVVLHGREGIADEASWFALTRALTYPRYMTANSPCLG